MNLDYAVKAVNPFQISRRTRYIALCLAIAMTVHYFVACLGWGLVIQYLVRMSGKPMRDLPQVIGQISIAWLMLSLFAWSTWSAWKGRRQSVRLLLIGLIGTIALVALERHFSLYQLGVRKAGSGEFAVYYNSWEIRGPRDRF